MLERIDTAQLLALLIISRVAISLLRNPLLADLGTGKDAWLIDLVGAPFKILITVLPTIWLLSRAPGLSLPLLLERLLGRWLTALLLGMQLLFVLLLLATDMREIGDFLAIAFLPRLSNLLPLLLMTGLAAWAALAGIEVMGRFAQIALPLLTLASLLLLLAVLRDIEWSVFRPLKMQQVGLLPALRGILIESGRWQEGLWLGLVAGEFAGRVRLGRSFLIASLWLALIWALLDIATTGILGPLQTGLFYSYLSVTRLVRIAGILERVDTPMLIVWLLCFVVRLGLLLWAGGRLLGAIFRLPYRPLILPLSGILIGLTVGIAPSVEQLRHHARPAVLMPLSFFVLLLPPLIALPLSYIRRKRLEAPQEQETPG